MKGGIFYFISEKMSLMSIGTIVGGGGFWVCLGPPKSVHIYVLCQYFLSNEKQ